MGESDYPPCQLFKTEELQNVFTIQHAAICTMDLFLLRQLSGTIAEFSSARRVLTIKPGLLVRATDLIFTCVIQHVHTAINTKPLPPWKILQWENKFQVWSNNKRWASTLTDVLHLYKLEIQVTTVQEPKCLISISLLLHLQDLISISIIHPWYCCITAIYKIRWFFRLLCLPSVNQNLSTESYRLLVSLNAFNKL